MREPVLRVRCYEWVGWGYFPRGEQPLRAWPELLDPLDPLRGQLPVLPADGDPAEIEVGGPAAIPAPGTVGVISEEYAR